MGEKQANKLIALAQAQIGEPVLAAAMVSPKGRQGAAAMGGMVGLAVHRAAKSDHAFAGLSLFAITDRALYAFGASHNFSVKLKEPIGAWTWGTFGASTAKGNVTRFLFLTWGDGVVHELETHTRGVNRFQAAFVDEVVRRATAAAGVVPPPVG